MNRIPYEWYLLPQAYVFSSCYIKQSHPGTRYFRNNNHFSLMLMLCAPGIQEIAAGWFISWPLWARWCPSRKQQRTRQRRLCLTSFACRLSYSSSMWVVWVPHSQRLGSWASIPKSKVGVEESNFMIWLSCFSRRSATIYIYKNSRWIDDIVIHT